ncbi:protein tyrosine kinase domain-containing protein [Ditylenchus destructor]|uniref:Tyrosine-protein kinase n=1 Tax=Ditylenchus destructor TaxID=166010 RepID=A0AAD4NE46_9BILA|nr:protein tyrosine kinase domain-containing protein [Ditylenchus destructor]
MPKPKKDKTSRKIKTKRNDTISEDHKDAKKSPIRSSGNSKNGTEHLKLDCWHGLLPDEDTTDLLKEDGDFLVRGVQDTPGIYLSVKWGPQIMNIAIVRQGDGRYRFRGKPFNTLKELLDHYQVRKMALPFEGDIKPVLGSPVLRKNWELRHGMIILGKQLGAGAYGTVYKGSLQKGMDKKPIEVAVKELSEMGFEASNALWREARVMRDYDHPNVLRMYGVANDYMPFYLVMEFVPDGSLEDYFRKSDKAGKKITTLERIEILFQAAAGMEYLHSKGCIHRDIATRNILIDLNGPIVKVADFGMTRRTSNYRIDPNKPMNLRWLAPEVYQNAVVKKSTDVYAFGVTMYECFTVPYDTPYKDWKPNTVYDKVVNKGYRLKPPHVMPREVGELMKECLGPENDRPSFRTIVQKLEFKRRSCTDVALHFTPTQV